jgi:hypothetical protein
LTHEAKSSRNRLTPRQKVSLFSVLVVLGSCTAQTNDVGTSAVGVGSDWGRAALAQVHTHDALVLTRLALAHVMTNALASDSAKQAAATEEELASWTAFHWAEVDRPQMFRTVHAVVRVKADAVPEEVQKAERVAQAIRVAVSGASDQDAFQTAAKAVPNEGLEVRAEGLDFVAADGRVMRLGGKASAQGGRYDVAYASAAAQLSSAGQITPVIRSSFGFHVIRLEETLPPIRLDEGTRRSLANHDVLERRARLAVQALLANERARINPVVERSAEEATAKVSVE